MRRPGVDHLKALAAERQRQPVVEGDVGRNDARLVVDPRRQRLAALVEPVAGALVRDLLVLLLVFARAVLGDDDGAGVILERLQAVNVVGVVVAEHDVADRFVGHLADLLQQRPAEARRAERIEHDDAVRRDDEAGVRRVALVAFGRHARMADAVIDRRAGNLADLQRRIERRVVLRGGGGRQDRQQQGGEKAEKRA